MRSMLEVCAASIIGAAFIFALGVVDKRFTLGNPDRPGGGSGLIVARDFAGENRSPLLQSFV